MRSSNILIFNTGTSLTVPSVPANAATTQTSFNIPLSNIYGWAAQVKFTGSPNGTILVNASCDPFGNNPQLNSQVPVNWTPIDNGSFTVSAAGNVLWNVNLAFYNWIQFVWTPSGGTGTLTGRVEIKGV